MRLLAACLCLALALRPPAAAAQAGAVAAGAIGHDAGRHCGADPECG